MPGKGLAPTSPTAERPSACRVSESVVQTSGACQRTNGALARVRGNGSAVRPPAVWVNRTQPSPVSAGARRSGRGTAANVAPSLPSRTVVDPMTTPPSTP
nr:hypothetical protein GCM10020093_046600 [Planobispora longispora]